MKERPFTNMCMEKLLSCAKTSVPKITVGFMKLCPKRKEEKADLSKVFPLE